MKKIAVAVVATAAFLVAALFGIGALAGYPPAYLVNAPGVATGIGAKLLCSSRYVSGFSKQQSYADLIQYSPILARLSVDYDDSARTVTASLLGLKSTTASYVPGIGCAVDFEDQEQRTAFEQRELPVFSSAWPHGNRVGPAEPAVQATVEQLIRQDNAEGLNTRALLVVHKGEIIAEAYAQGATAETPLLGWSMAKSLTSIMLGNLEMRGLLDLESTPADTLGNTEGFDAWHDDGRAGIRIVDLLTMTDGLDFSEVYDPGEDATAMLFTAPSASDYALSRPLLHEPGSRFHYSTGTANILSRIHYNATGATLQSSYEDYLRHIAIPMSFQHGVSETDSSGVFAGGSYFYASARDWARIGQMMLNKGVLNGHRIVSEDWVERATSPNNSRNEKAYGYQWWLNRTSTPDPSARAGTRWADLPPDAYAARGNREQRMMVIPSENLVIVRLGWTSGSYPTNQRFSEILRQVSAEEK